MRHRPVAEPLDAYRVSVVAEPVAPGGEPVALSGVGRFTVEIDQPEEDRWMVGFGDTSPVHVAGPRRTRLIVDWIPQQDGSAYRMERPAGSYPPRRREAPAQPATWARTGRDEVGPADTLAGLGVDHSGLQG